MFTNREEAGLKLAHKLSSYKKKADVLVLGIPRGGVVTAYTIARMLKVPIDVLVTRKIGAPNQPELAIGAVGPEGEVVLDQKLIKELGVDKKWLKREVKGKRQEVKERTKRFRFGRPPLKFILKPKLSVILVDDGIATGATVEATIKYLKNVGVKKIVLAVPVAPRDTVERFRGLVHEYIVLETPPGFYAVGQFYQDFPQVTDEEVVELLQSSK